MKDDLDDQIPSINTSENDAITKSLDMRDIQVSDDSLKNSEN